MGAEHAFAEIVRLWTTEVLPICTSSPSLLRAASETLLSILDVKEQIGNATIALPDAHILSEASIPVSTRRVGAAIESNGGKEVASVDEAKEDGERSHSITEPINLEEVKHNEQKSASPRTSIRDFFGPFSKKLSNSVPDAASLVSTAQVLSICENINQRESPTFNVSRDIEAKADAEPKKSTIVYISKPTASSGTTYSPQVPIASTKALNVDKESHQTPTSSTALSLPPFSTNSNTSSAASSSSTSPSVRNSPVLRSISPSNLLLVKEILAEEEREIETDSHRFQKKLIEKSKSQHAGISPTQSSKAAHNISDSKSKSISTENKKRSRSNSLSLDFGVVSDEQLAEVTKNLASVHQAMHDQDFNALRNSLRVLARSTKWSHIPVVTHFLSLRGAEIMVECVQLISSTRATSSAKAQSAKPLNSAIISSLVECLEAWFGGFDHVLQKSAQSLRASRRTDDESIVDTEVDDEYQDALYNKYFGAFEYAGGTSCVSEAVSALLGHRCTDKSYVAAISLVCLLRPGVQYATKKGFASNKSYTPTSPPFNALPFYVSHALVDIPRSVNTCLLRLEFLPRLLPLIKTSAQWLREWGKAENVGSLALLLPFLFVIAEEKHTYAWEYISEILSLLNQIWTAMDTCFSSETQEESRTGDEFLDSLQASLQIGCKELRTSMAKFSSTGGIASLSQILKKLDSTTLSLLSTSLFPFLSILFRKCPNIPSQNPDLVTSYAMAILRLNTYDSIVSTSFPCLISALAYSFPSPSRGKGATSLTGPNFPFKQPQIKYLFDVFLLLYRSNSLDAVVTTHGIVMVEKILAYNLSDKSLATLWIECRGMEFLAGVCHTGSSHAEVMRADGQFVEDGLAHDYNVMRKAARHLTKLLTSHPNEGVSKLATVNFERSGGNVNSL